MMHIEIEDIAGIRTGKADIHPGLNVVRAENWQGKSSFLTAMQVVMGTTGMDSDHPLRDGSPDGSVTLVDGSDTYETELVRSGRTVTRDGDTYLTDEQDRSCARLFAFLGENNPIRAAVRNNEPLAPLLTQPLDIENIDERIAELTSERQAVETELERARDAADRIVSVQQSVADLETTIEELESEYEQMREEAEPAERSHEQSDLSDKRAKQEQLRTQITTLENKIDRQEQRLEDRQSELDSLTVPAEPEFTADIEAKRERIRELETDRTLLEDLYRTNKRVLDEGKASLVTDIEHSIAADELNCWLCGEETSESIIAARLADIDDKITALAEERDQLEDDIETIQTQRDEIRRTRRRKSDLEAEISELEVEIAENRSRLEERTDQVERVSETIEELQESVAETTDALTDLESEIKYKRSELAERKDELEELEARADRRDQLAAEREQLQTEIESLRNRRNEKKREVADRFAETMREIIDKFGVGFDAARLDPKTDSEGEITEFDLVIARDGRETSLDALSEGEVELLGIVTALAGYETFNVGERVPFALLDGLTALSKENYYSVVEYLRARTDCLVTTAYPEIDEFEANTVTPTEWDVVSHQQPSAS